MACEIVSSPTLGRVIVCSRGRRPRPRCNCGRPAPLACDHPIAPGRTCDAPICRGCATRIGPDLDLCPGHADHAGPGPLFTRGGS